MEEQRLRPPRGPQIHQQGPAAPPSSAIPRGRAQPFTPPPLPPRDADVGTEAMLSVLNDIHYEMETSKSILLSILLELQRLNSFAGATGRPPATDQTADSPSDPPKE
jgi:hypothetical protein